MERRLDERAAFVALTHARAVGAKAKGGGELQMKHLLPEKPRKTPGKIASVQAMIRFAELATMAWGGKDLRKRG